jgi:uncharacterized protein YPO0396
LADEPLRGPAEQPAVAARLTETRARDGALGGRDLATWTRRLGAAAETIALARVRLGDRLEAAKQEGRGLEAEQAELGRGRLRYPDGAEALLHLLRTRLRSAREPRALAELIEVPAARWRDAVEGFLNTRRFDVIVAPEDFLRALGLYERHKRGWSLPGRGEVFIAGVGLVDAERIMATPRRAEKRSLAEQVVTHDALARAYVDFLLGDVMCCDDEQELRRHRRAITDTVMVYQHGVARQTAPEVFRRHYIGEAARVRRLDEIARRLADLSDEVIGLARDVDWLERAAAACRKAMAEVTELPRLVDEAERLADLRARVVLLQRQLDRVDRCEIAGLEQDLERVRAESRRLDEARVRLHGERAVLEDEVQRRSTEREVASRARDAATEALRDFVEGAMSGPEHDTDRRPGFPGPAATAWGAMSAPPARSQALEQRYLREREERSAAEIREVFERQFRSIDTRVATLAQTLVRLKTEYVNAYGLAADVEGESWEAFAAQRELWRESRLPEYRERISRAKEEAIQQLAEDIIFRLRENLVDVRRQIDELDRALKDVPFGGERYVFTLEVAASHRAFHDLVMEAGRFEKESLFGATALADGGVRRTLEELFERLVQAEARQVKTDLEERADYREYFDYDLRILHADGSQSSWDRVAGDRSGGETQTPYYIAIFASLYRLYRSLAPDGRPRAGLVLLDEAFSKMDESRIAATLTFARGLGLQLVMATPKERSELVAPWVETALYIHKDAVTGLPTVLDFSKEFTPDGDGPRA